MASGAGAAAAGSGGGAGAAATGAGEGDAFVLSPFSLEDDFFFLSPFSLEDAFLSAARGWEQHSEVPHRGGERGGGGGGDALLGIRIQTQGGHPVFTHRRLSCACVYVCVCGRERVCACMTVWLLLGGWTGKGRGGRETLGNTTRGHTETHVQHRASLGNKRENVRRWRGKRGICMSVRRERKERKTVCVNRECACVNERKCV